MAAILLAGGPGAGKSTVSAALRDRGLCSIDLDYGYARHEDSRGAPVSFPSSPSRAWLDTHYWQWIDDRLTQAVAQYESRNAVFCGTAYNMFDHLDGFALVVLLQLDNQTLEARLRDPRRNNIFGTAGDSLAWSRWWRSHVESELLSRNTHPIDARQPLDRVVEALLTYCATEGYPISEDEEPRTA
jgi:hypothetical protein